MRLAVAVASLLAFDQALHRIALADGELFGRRIAPFDPPTFNRAQDDVLAAIESHARSGATSTEGFDFDAELGWGPCERGDPLYRYDWAGCRLGLRELARVRDAGERRIAVLGDSFVFGYEVRGERSWPALLDDLAPGIEVANLGIAGYGLDQALLRWRRERERIAPDEAWLGLLPTALPRLVTVYQPAFVHWTQGVAVKPRFRIGDLGELELLEQPAKSLGELVALVRSQPRFLDATQGRDAWVTRSPLAYAARGSDWRLASGLVRLWSTHHERGARAAEPYLRDPSSEPFRLALAIVAAMRDEVEAARARFRVVVLPDRGELRAAAEGDAPSAALIDALRARSIEVVDLIAPLVARAAHDEPAFWAPQGHYSELGNQAVAQELARCFAR